LGGDDLPCISHIQNFVGLLKEYELQDVVNFDISIVRGLGYYTGLVFEAFDAKGKFRALFGGGRYDNLLADLGGKDMTAVGLGFGDVVVAELINDIGLAKSLSKQFDLAIGYMTLEQRSAALKLAVKLRNAGLAVDLALAPEKARRFFSRVGRGDFFRATYIGPDDMTTGKAKIKNLSDQTEELIDLTQ
jgi:histidyl-tRNA synthetase